jgi:hypothetical protein
MRVATVFILGWFAVALTLSVTGWFERFSSATLFGVGAVASASGFIILHWFSSTFRGFLRARSLKRLTMAQALRFYGILALVKAHEHILPPLFAIPTGVLDIIFASTSFLVAARLVSANGQAKLGFFAWHVLGLVALAISTVTAILTSSERFGLVRDGITTQPMSCFPMSLVPTFVGPMVLIFHLLALVCARPARGALQK